MRYINLNGRLYEKESAGLPIDNRAFRYGYALFETILFREGEICLVDLHDQRLFAGIDKLGFTVHKHFSFSVLAEQIVKTVKKNRLEQLCRVRLQVFAGSGGVLEASSFEPNYLIECYELDEHVLLLNENGLTLGFAKGIAKANDGLANLKTANALVYAMAGRQAKEYKWNDALVCNTAGNIIESVIANLFWVEQEQVFTVPLSDGCIAGVMRQHIINLLRQKDINVSERSITATELSYVNEVFLTNAIRGVKWVKAIDNTTYSNQVIQTIAAMIA